MDIALILAIVVGLLSGALLVTARQALHTAEFRARMGNNISLFLGLFVPLFGVMLFFRTLFSIRDFIAALAFAVLVCAFFIVRLLIEEHRHILRTLRERDTHET